MTDPELLKRAIELCERGPRLPLHEKIERPRLKRILADDDELQARYLVPALVDMIERRGLGGELQPSTPKIPGRLADANEDLIQSMDEIRTWDKTPQGQVLKPIIRVLGSIAVTLAMLYDRGR